MVKPAGAYRYSARYPRTQRSAARRLSGQRGVRDDQICCPAGAIDEEKVVLESLGAIKRAGADLIFSYFALDLAEKKILR